MQDIKFPFFEHVGDRLICKATVIQKWKRRSFVEIKLFNDCNRLMSVAGGNYTVLAKR